MASEHQARAPHRRQPLVVAVTGHRDLVASEIDGIRDRVRTLFLFLQNTYPDLELRLMSPLLSLIAVKLALRLTRRRNSSPNSVPERPG